MFLKGDNVKEFFYNLKNKFSFKYIKSILPLIVLALSDVVVMAIPFYMENYIPRIYENFKLRPEDFSQASAIYGYVAMPFYIFGSYIADKFKSKNLIVISLTIMTFLGGWYIALPFMEIAASIKRIQLYFIFAGFALATCGFYWAPLWKLVKNYGTEKLKGIEKEKRVATNNGIQGAANGLIGLTIALLGILFYFLAGGDGHMNNVLPNFGNVSSGFIILVIIYVGLIALSIILTVFFIKEPPEKEFSFSIKSTWDIIKNWKIWLLGFLVLGIYMLQMGLSSYINYLKNIFRLGTITVMILGIFRTYIMRFLISPVVGRKADKAHSYIFLILIGLLIGIGLVLIAVLLPWFGNATNLVLQIVAGFNLILLGIIAWVLVTIRWSPLGTELKLKNDQYGAGVNIISFIAFTPDAFFRQIKALIEKNNYFEIDGARHANQLGNQLILLVVIGFAFFGLISGIILYISLYKDKIKARLFKNKNNLKLISD